MSRLSNTVLFLTCFALTLFGCASRPDAPPPAPLPVVKVERVTIPDALLICPADPAPRPVNSQRDVAVQLEIAMAALHTCQINMMEIRKLNQTAQ